MFPCLVLPPTEDTAVLRVDHTRNTMGGGVSSAASEQMGEMMAYSVLLSKTITRMSFPGTDTVDTFTMCHADDNRYYCLSCTSFIACALL